MASLDFSNESFSSLEKHLHRLSEVRRTSSSSCSNLALLIAYQQNLCARLGVVQVRLSDAAPRAKYSHHPDQFARYVFSMAQTSHDIRLLRMISKTAWAAGAVGKESAEVFSVVHEKFQTLLEQRDKLLMARNAPRNGKYEIKEESNKNANKASGAIYGFDKAINININRTDKLENTFIPTNRVVNELAEKIDSGKEISNEELQSLIQDYQRSQKELYGSLSDVFQTQVNSSYFLNFPHLDIIRDLPEYQEAIDSIGNNVVEVRAELNELAKSVMRVCQIIKYAFSNFEKCFCLPRIRFDVTNHLINIEVQHYLAQRKANFFKTIVKNAKMDVPYSWESLNFLNEELAFSKDTLISIKRILENGDPESITKCKNLFDEAFARYEKYESAIQKEIQYTKEKKAKADKESNKWVERSMKVPEQPDGRIQKDLENYRIEFDNKFNRNQQIKKECNEKLSSTMGRLRDVILQIDGSHVIPSSFEDRMKIISDKNSKLEWLRNKAAALKKDIEKKKKEIEKLHKQESRYDQLIAQKQEEFQRYQDKSSKEPSLDNAQSLNDYNEYREKYCCYCVKDKNKNKRREVILKKCKHTFCEHCIQKQIKLRNRKCPYCSTHFVPNADNLYINWEKKPQKKKDS